MIQLIFKEKEKKEKSSNPVLPKKVKDNVFSEKGYVFSFLFSNKANWEVLSEFLFENEKSTEGTRHWIKLEFWTIADVLNTLFSVMKRHSWKQKSNK